MAHAPTPAVPASIPTPAADAASTDAAAELDAWLRLHLTSGIGPSTVRRLLALWGSPEHIFSRSAEELLSNLGAAQAAALLRLPDDWDAQRERTLQWLAAAPTQASVQRRILTLGDPAYPSSLLETDDPPLLLYAMGTPACFESSASWGHAENCIAVVGSRNTTPQGLANAQQFAQALASAGLTVVSGMALGVDGAAHEGALLGARLHSASGANSRANSAHAVATIAVVGTGLDRIYPRQHQALAHRIAEHGLLISEYPLGTPPLGANFPRRNRIISGLSAGTLVVEAALQSGSLITARMALDQGREVFAIPGSIHATQARGCHALIKQGAKLVETVQDVLDEMPPRLFMSTPATAESAGAPDTGIPSETPLHTDHSGDADADAGAGLGTPPSPADLPPEQASLLMALGFDPTGLDVLQARTGLPTATLLAQLLELQLAGQVSRQPGSLFQRLVLA